MFFLLSQVPDKFLCNYFIGVKQFVPKTLQNEKVLQVMRYSPVGQGCFCPASQSICEKGWMCNTRNSSCSQPALCPPPEEDEDWATLNMTNAQPRPVYTEGDNLTLVCSLGTLLNEQVST